MQATIKAGKVVHGVLSPAARLYKIHCIKLFFDDVPPHLIALLLKRCTGDWRKSDMFEVLVPPDTDITVELEIELLGECADIITLVCMRATWRVYPRHRWLGADVAINDEGKLESMNCLMSAGYELFAATKQQHTTSSGSAAPSSELPKPVADGSINISSFDWLISRCNNSGTNHNINCFQNNIYVFSFK